MKLVSIVIALIGTIIVGLMFADSGPGAWDENATYVGIGVAVLGVICFIASEAMKKKA